MCLFYGIYVVTFGISLNVAFRRRDSTASKVFTNGVVSLFVLISIMNAAVAWSAISDTIFIYNTIQTQDYVALSEYLSLTDRHFTSRMVQFCLSDMSSVAMSAITQYLLVHRCWIIWGSRKPVFGLLALPFFVGHEASSLAVIIMAEVTISRGNVALYQTSTTITHLLVIMGSVHSLLLSFATAISVALTWVGDRDDKGVSPLSYLGQVFASQMAGLAPTLLIVRIAYGKSVDNVQQMVSTLQFGGDAPVIDSQRQSNTVRTTVNLDYSRVEMDEEGPIGVAEAYKTPARAM
ncbi:hypothetical protein PM082_021154 [Marasmius tenuissimus]|nr:hypothetical protein PM082_021154 [Marasmius tenuissimus]